jgi:hypothetical protein
MYVSGVSLHSLRPVSHWSLDSARSTPYFDSDAGGYRGGIDTKYQSDFKPECQTDKDENSYNEEDEPEEEEDEENKEDGGSNGYSEETQQYKYKPRRRPGVRYTSMTRLCSKARLRNLRYSFRGAVVDNVNHETHHRDDDLP